MTDEADRPEDRDERRPAGAAFVMFGLVACALAMGAREPRLLAEPRFWAEEGAVYLAAAWREGSAALLLPQQGYLHLPANLGAFLASRVAPELAPAVTTGVAFLLQLLPALVLLTAGRVLLPGRGPRLLGALGLALVLPSGEVWLNLPNSQAWCALACGIVLVERAQVREGRWLRRAVLLVGGLAGLASCLLLPAFLVGAWRGSREARIQAGVLALATLVQAGVFWTHGGASGGRLRIPRARDVPVVLATKQVLLPLAGPAWTERAYVPLMRVRHRGPGSARALGIACAVLWGALLVVLVAPLEGRSRLVAVLGVAGLAIGGILGAPGAPAELLPPGAGERYFFAPNALLWLLALAGAVHDRPSTQRATARVLAVLVLGQGIAWARAPWRGAYAGPAPLPRWRDEVAAWRRDPGRALRIWPRGWEVRAPPPR